MKDFLKSGLIAVVLIFGGMFAVTGIMFMANEEWNVKGAATCPVTP